MTLTASRLTGSSALVALAGLLLFAALCLYWTIRAWRSSPEAWRTINEQNRPASWQRWPVYRFLWRDIDRHPSRYLWQVRILGVLSLVAALAFAVLIFSNL